MTHVHAPRQVILAMLGSYSISDYTKKAAVAMFLFFAFFVILLMLNLLIAIMGDSSRGRRSHFHVTLFVFCMGIIGGVYRGRCK